MTQDLSASWSTTARLSRVEMAAAARRPPTVFGAVACRDMSVGRVPTTSTSASVDRVKMEELASTLSAAIGKLPTSGPDLRGGGQASHQQGASHQTLHILFSFVICVCFAFLIFRLLLSPT